MADSGSFEVMYQSTVVTEHPLQIPTEVLFLSDYNFLIAARLYGGEGVQAQQSRSSRVIVVLDPQLKGLTNFTHLTTDSTTLSLLT